MSHESFVKTHGSMKVTFYKVFFSRQLPICEAHLQYGWCVECMQLFDPPVRRTAGTRIQTVNAAHTSCVPVHFSIINRLNQGSRCCFLAFLPSPIEGFTNVFGSIRRLATRLPVIDIYLPDFRSNGERLFLQFAIANPNGNER